MDHASTARINKFDGNNFHAWKFKMQMVLEERDLWEVVSGEVKPEHCVTELDQATFKRKSRKAMAIICLAMEDSQLPLVRSASGAHDAWSKLEDQFEKKSLANKLFLRRFFTTMMEEGDDELAHINEVKTLAEQLDAVGAPVSEDDLVITLLGSLSESYQFLITALESRSDTLTWKLVTSRLLHEHQIPMSDEAPTCPSSVDIHATELCRSVDGLTASFLDDESVDLHDQQSTQPPSDALPESLITGVGLNEKTIERLWKWKSAHRGQIEALQQRCSTLEERCESLENLVADHESKIDVPTEGCAQCSALESRFEERFQQVQDELVRLQKNEKSRELAHDRLLRSVEEAGSALEVLRGEYHSRLQALEAVKDQSFDVLQLLYAEKNLQSDELFALRNQVEKLHDQLDRLRKISQDPQIHLEGKALVYPHKMSGVDACV
ncbi:Copia proteinlike, partial [Globisporangium splendens]